MVGNPMCQRLSASVIRVDVVSDTFAVYLCLWLTLRSVVSLCELWEPAISYKSACNHVTRINSECGGRYGLQNVGLWLFSHMVGNYVQSLKTSNPTTTYKRDSWHVRALSLSYVAGSEVSTEEVELKKRVCVWFTDSVFNHFSRKNLTIYLKYSISLLLPCSTVFLHVFVLHGTL
jgi:hypothetical protein